MKSGFWRKDWFLGLAVSLAMLLPGGSQIMQSRERSAYDWGVIASSHDPSDKVAIVAIDKQSLDNIGRWPAGNVLLLVKFATGEPLGKPDKPLPDFIRTNALAMHGAREFPAALRVASASVVAAAGTASFGSDINL